MPIAGDHGREGITGKNFKSLRYPLWTQNKARLIEAYLQLFEYITHHGTYIDGFAAPQDTAHPEMWAAKLVLEMVPKWFRDFWLCDISAEGIQNLKILQADHASRKRRVTVLEGDFNEKVHEILQSGQITERTAAFALLDQRTFECEWRTVDVLSRHKSSGNKIEIFYFLATGWIDRSLGAVKSPETKQKVERWWGRSDWGQLLGMDGTIRAQMVALTAAEFHQLAEVPLEIEWFNNISNRGTRRVYKNTIRDFMRFTGIVRPEEFRIVTRAHVIAWRDDLERRGLEGPTTRTSLPGHPVILTRPPTQLVRLEDASLRVDQRDALAVEDEPVSKIAGFQAASVSGRHAPLCDRAG